MKGWEIIMSENNSLVPVVANALVEVSGNITNFVTKAKASGVIRRAQLEILRKQTTKVVVEIRTYNLGDIIMTNLDQIARTQEHIDNLERQGRLHGASLTMAMDQLTDLNNILRRNLRKYENGELR